MRDASPGRLVAAASGRRRIAGGAGAVLAVLAWAAPGASPQAAPGGARPRASALDSDTARGRGAAASVGVARTVRGRVVRSAGEERLGVPGVWVVLHRVGADRAGPLDSLRSGADGRYRFRYRATGSEDAIYFVSAEYGGIAYFSSPLRHRDVAGEDAEVTVFDTTSRAVPLRVAGRHLVVSALGPEGSREIVEVYELSNDTTVTLISPDDARPTWTAALPDGASGFRAGQGDVSPEAVRMVGGRVTVVAPFAPGVKQVSFSYRLPRTSFPLSVPLLGGAEVFEVLLEDSAATVSGARLQSVPAVSVEGRTFRRFLGHDVPPSSVARISVPVVRLVSRRSLYVVGVAVAIGVLMLAALARTFARPLRPVPAHHIVRGVAAAPAPAGDPDALAREIVGLDREFESRPSAGAAERAAYESTRRDLKERLARALAARRGAG